MDFLKRYFGDHVNTDQQLVMIAVPQDGDWKKAETQWFDSFEKAESFYEKHKAESNLYFSCNLMAPGGRQKHHARCMTGFYLDIDTNNGVHKGSKPPAQEIAAYLKSGKDFPVPTTVVNSGGGFHCYWEFLEPVKPAEAVLKIDYLDKIVGIWHKAKGYTYEKTGDLARILRVPGSFNWKQNSDPKLVKEIFHVGEKLKLSDFPDPPETETEKPIKEVDQELASRKSLSDCARVAPEWGADGSSYVMKLLFICILNGCQADTAIGVVREMISEHPDFPTEYSDDQLLRKYEQSFERNKEKFGTKSNRPIGWAESDVADLIVEQQYKRLYYVEEWDCWQYWTGEYFESSRLRAHCQGLVADARKELLNDPPNDPELLKEFRKGMQRLKSDSGVRGVCNLIKNDAAIAIKADAFVNDMQLLPVKNCTLLLPRNKGGAVQAVEHHPRHMNRFVAPITYDPAARCDRWRRYIDEVSCGNKEYADFIQRAVGYSFLGTAAEQCMMILFGAGSNGKSVLTNTMGKLLGDYAYSVDPTIFVSAINEQPRIFAQMQGRRAIFSSEVNRDCYLNEARVKLIADRVPLNGRKIYGSDFNFTPSHVVWLSTNHLPTIQSTDHGIWRRLKILPFNATFPVDRDFEDREITPELSGILNWVLEGIDRYLSHGLAEPPAVKNAGDALRGESDIFAEWVRSNCVTGAEHSATVMPLYRNLKWFLQQSGHNPTTYNSKTMKQRLVQDFHCQDIGHTKAGRTIQGINLKPDENADF